jgi:hypothetical protein
MEEFKGYYCPKCKLTIDETYIKWEKPQTCCGTSVISIPICMACRSHITLRFMDVQKLEDKLGFLAMSFRSNKDEEHREKVAREYAQVVLDLIESKEWYEMPTFEDMLPSEYMSNAFYDYWGLRHPERNQSEQSPSSTS